ncbi:hypothetical protein CAI21_03395 [Alkalilimnicola ehrlichii]|uniref:NADH:quinone oxidoreductase/Mrp antiporter transmembrane domain-containing protein n=1 Tax=Alkalilimnicola ehrlichii TaxID=351052 RepID=A0A3E0X304_9GAMM|nr:proton-conducting transporter membrane subunit [Alkalilimnicola ehrlichii]RFA31030.1 hypothetical protein CAI21_03395 [Alkalilimnicola ehrlichii]RFA38983.1 hypothetical protein CAL65_03545 [Alkalilimnicola ehrlichii]
MSPEVWLLGVCALPLLAAPTVYVLGPRCLPLLPMAVSASVLVSAVALWFRFVEKGAWTYALAGWDAPLGILWRVDATSLLMIIATALVALLVALFSQEEEAAMGGSKRAVVFWPLFLFLLGSLNALFLSGDIFNIYVSLELVSLAAVSMVVLGGSVAALRAAMRYLLIALAGSMSYLLGVGLLYALFGTLDVGLLAERMEPVAAARFAFVLMAVGLLAKTALFPLHVWLPPAHSSAPTAASALLSALVVMGSMYWLLRLWLEVFAPIMPVAFAQLLGALGALAVLWGSAMALVQRRLKLLVAYSTIAQFGYVLLLLPLTQSMAAAAAWSGGLWLLLSHAFAKSAMFLAAGLILHARRRDYLSDVVGAASQLPMAVFALGLAGLTLMGLPPSGGFVAKWLLLEASISSGQWWWVLVLIGGGFLAAGYVFSVLKPAFRGPRGAAQFAPVPHWPQAVCLAMAVISVLMGLYPAPFLEWLALAAGGAGGGG